MSRMDKKDKMQKEAELEAREEALEEEALPVEDAADASQAPKGPTQEELDAAKAKADEYLTLAQRVQADFDNFRRRNESVRADAYNEGIRALAATLLPVMDNLERGLSQFEEGDPHRQGMEMICRQFMTVLEKLGVQQIEALGQPFDPARHNAVMHVEDESAGENTVVEVFQQGYAMDDKVLRFAMVKVAN